MNQIENESYESIIKSKNEIIEIQEEMIASLQEMVKLSRNAYEPDREEILEHEERYWAIGDDEPERPQV